MFRDDFGRAYYLSEGKWVPLVLTKEEKRLYVARYCFNLCILWYGGGACVCCGDSHREFLTLDHEDGRGRRKVPFDKLRGADLAIWLVRHDFPDGIRVLCWNCNCAVGIRGGVCPHVKERDEARDRLVG